MELLPPRAILLALWAMLAGATALSFFILRLTRVARWAEGMRAEEAARLLIQGKEREAAAEGRLEGDGERRRETRSLAEGDTPEKCSSGKENH